MSLDTLFSVANTGVLPFLLLIVVAPRWVWTRRLVHSVMIPALYGVLYIGLFVSAPEAPEGSGMSSLDGVVALFSVRQTVFAGWVHYLIFDLFVGAWIARDAERRGIHHGIVVPCLVFTLTLGPTGLLLYAIVRGVMQRTGSLVEGIRPGAAA